jgi:hypothetical protein
MAKRNCDSLERMFMSLCLLEHGNECGPILPDYL